MTEEEWLDLSDDDDFDLDDDLEWEELDEEEDEDEFLLDDEDWEEEIFFKE